VRKSPDPRLPKRLALIALVYYFYYVKGLMDVGLNSGQLALPGDDLLFARLDALAATVYGGTSESQRNITAESVLELPKG